LSTERGRGRFAEAWRLFGVPMQRIGRVQAHVMRAVVYVVVLRRSPSSCVSPSTRFAHAGGTPGAPAGLTCLPRPPGRRSCDQPPVVGDDRWREEFETD
jgi:hypothetical protein